ncbi:MAG: bifunctional heptose 7-phosphate kinase/heptose 1-phosphate adenyltransferase [Aeoliella sp.]
MNVAEMTQDRLAELIDAFPLARIAVVGDFFLDKYLDCDPAIEERSVETGRAAHQVTGIRTSPGCAGTVVGNLASLGAGTLYAIGTTGNDGEGYDLRHRLKELGCQTEHLHAIAGRMTPTYLKPRNMRDVSLAGEHDRYDTRNRTETDAATEQLIIHSLDVVLPNVDALVIMDQVEERNRGVITEVVRNAIVERATRFEDIVFWADSRRRIREYQHVIIKPNEFEALGRETWLPDERVDLMTLRPAVEKLRRKVKAPIVVTRGALGLIVTDPEWTVVPGVRVDGEIDPTGAGDSVSAGMVMALCSGAELPEAAIVSNLVASITVQQLATTGLVQPDQLSDRLNLWHQQRNE